jgi:hypothetical protein
MEEWLTDTLLRPSLHENREFPPAESCAFATGWRITNWPEQSARCQLDIPATANGLL